MAVPKLIKNWTISPNLRRVFVSFPDLMGWFGFQTISKIKAAGWTVKWTSDGTTGPVDANDNTDRITDETKFQTRGTVAAAPQSWFVLQNADSVQLLVAFQGAGDDQARISYSPGGLFTLAATTTHQPTASDDRVINQGVTIFNSTASADRVMTIWATTESWAFALYRSGITIAYIGLEKFDSAVSPTIQNKPYICFNITDPTRAASLGSLGGGASSTAFGAAGWRGVATHHTFGGVARQSRMGAAFGTCPNAASFNPSTFVNALANQPALQNLAAMPLMPPMFLAENSANVDGFMGSPIDWWYGWGTTTSQPAAGDMFPGLDPSDAITDPPRTNWLVALGAGAVRPWRNAAASLQIS